MRLISNKTIYVLWKIGGYKYLFNVFFHDIIEVND